MSRFKFTSVSCRLLSTNFPKSVYKPLEKLIVYPLKKTRLSSPFPEPFKAFAYDVVSDIDKAKIMQDSIRMPKGSN